MQLFAILVASLVLSSVVVYVAVNVARETGDVGDITVPAAGPAIDELPQLPVGACARFTLEQDLAAYLNYYINTCEPDVYELDCLPVDENQTVYWSSTANCTQSILFYDSTYYENYDQDTFFFPCCPARLMLIEERSTVYPDGPSQPMEYVRHACVEIQMGATAPRNSYIQDLGNRTLRVYNRGSYDQTTSVAGDNCDNYASVTRGASLNAFATDLTPYERLNAVDLCDACLLSGYNVPVPSCDIGQCNIPFALPKYTKVPYVGACARYTPHPVLPGYNNTCTMTLEEDCVASSVPGEIVHWTDERTAYKCRDFATRSLVEYDNSKRAIMMVCPGDSVLLQRNASGDIDFWCLDKDEPWTGYLGTATYLFFASTGCNIRRTFSQSANIGTLVSNFSTGVETVCFVSDSSIRFTTDITTDPFYLPIVTSL